MSVVADSLKKLFSGCRFLLRHLLLDHGDDVHLRRPFATVGHRRWSVVRTQLCALFRVVRAWSPSRREKICPRRLVLCGAAVGDGRMVEVDSILRFSLDALRLCTGTVCRNSPDGRVDGGLRTFLPGGVREQPDRLLVFAPQQDSCRRRSSDCCGFLVSSRAWKDERRGSRCCSSRPDRHFSGPALETTGCGSVARRTWSALHSRLRQATTGRL